jgi:uncharacterized membrane protein
LTLAIEAQRPSLRVSHQALHPLQTILLISALPLFAGALLSDWAYASTSLVQWINFAAWLIAGALVFAGAALVWAGVDLFRVDRRPSSALWLYPVLLISTFVTGFVNALVHAKDAWATMPEGLILSVLTLLLMLASLWLAFGGRLPGAER